MSLPCCGPDQCTSYAILLVITTIWPEVLEDYKSQGLGVLTALSFCKPLQTGNFSGSHHCFVSERSNSSTFMPLTPRACVPRATKNVEL